jgi:hypothetical protein
LPSYRGYADKLKCPANDANPAENCLMQARKRAWHEMLNGQLKTWGILSQIFRHNIFLHGNVFQACALETELTMDWQAAF